MGDSNVSFDRYDALVVGAGFSGISMLYRLRKLGLNAKIFEAGDQFGGTWHWNRYPGARVDSEFPWYQLNIPEVYMTWTFKERYPDHREIRAYFAHADKVLNLRKDTQFNRRVVDCSWDDDAGEWTVKTHEGQVVKTRFLLLCSGLLHQRHIPDLPGLKDYKGEVYHSSFYPEDLNLKGKRVGLVGAGATAVQITQDVAKVADHLTIFIRRPSTCLPAGQRPVSDVENRSWRQYLGAVFKESRTSTNGFLPVTKPTKTTLEATAEERNELWEELWKRGAFAFWTQSYADSLTSKEANKLHYEFWARKVRARMTDEKKMQYMAPLPADKMPYYIFTKRPPLEIDYYEMVDKPSVDVVNTNETPSKKFNETGIEMDDGRQIDFDILILATGFDAFSGSLSKMGLKNRDGTDLRDYWKDGIRSYMGMASSGFPNAFMCYTSMAPTALSNGTTTIEVQADFATAAIKQVLDSEKEGRKIKSVEATHEAEDEWEAYVDEQNAPTLMPFTGSWWTGANIPGKKPQQLTYLKGLSTYESEVMDKLDGWKGFEVRYWDGDEATVVVAEPNVLKRKAGDVDRTDKGKYGPQEVEEASEAKDILRPTAVA
ncbi:hypothetical protein KVR01_002091 [Diaporthe batatas]|uniref:uncharacterized protein n=1 Tax=Diaporthe batatas TaxID=748121 RepID=UPI001D049DA8|nr:uncharacterized protein KVR01_002091 [Diaporthe batatas]KAG8166402.1 hypothetical protein KVR01_002091 [Diaporthe batatas]